MQINIVTTFITTEEPRIVVAQNLCLSSISRFDNIKLIPFQEKPRPRFNDMLAMARAGGQNEYFGWINSDCQLLLNPQIIINQNTLLDVIGLKRIEIGTGQKCGGVDGYLIKKAFYDKHLCDGPKMWIGASHIDWWISRAAQRFGNYQEGVFLAHVPHERTKISIGELGAENIQAFNEWADAKGVSKDYE